jgi:hypothetical protein
MPIPNLLQFFVDAKGFGLGLLLGLDMNVYAPDSVLLLLAYLAEDYRTDPHFLAGLQGISRECADLYRLGQVSPVQLELQAVAAVNKYLPLAK